MNENEAPKPAVEGAQAAAQAEVKAVLKPAEESTAGQVGDSSTLKKTAQSSKTEQVASDNTW